MAAKIFLHRYNFESEIRFRIIREVNRTVRPLRLTGRELKFKVNKAPEGVDEADHFRLAIRDIVNFVLSSVDDDDLVGMVFVSSTITQAGYLTLRKANTVTVDDLWTVISNIFQSNTEGINTDEFCLSVVTVTLPTGDGRMTAYDNLQQFSTCKRSIISINNYNDHMCLPRALVVGKALADSDLVLYNRVSRNAKTVQLRQAKQLMLNAGVELNLKGMGISELKHFQEYLKDYKIVVYKFEISRNRKKNLMFVGKSNSEKRINLLYGENHYNVIKSLTGAFSCKKYCCHCEKPYDKYHMCSKKCYGCLKVPACVKTTDTTSCIRCKREFKSIECFENHTYKNCMLLQRCVECFKTFYTQRGHICGEKFCQLCKLIVPNDHLCFMKPDIRDPPMSDFLYIFYDFETTQENVFEHKKSVEGGEDAFQHQVNLCVMQQFCRVCIGYESKIECLTCGSKTTIFGREDYVVHDFLKYILSVRRNYKDIVCIAHNAQGFDSHFVLRQILEDTSHTPSLILRGLSIIFMKIDNVRFLDSMCYFPMALSALPKAFNLKTNLKKGTFPHLFNKKTNQNYVGTLPSLEYYSIDSMSSTARNDFLEWYEENKDSVFDFKKELRDYCINDVEILSQACIAFRKLFLTECRVEPFIECSTIASACNRVFRRLFLKENMIGLIPKNGYRMVNNQSSIAMHWLVYVERTRGILIQHAGRGREKVVCGVAVDGYYEEGDTKEVFAFQGCWFHGCLCLKYNRSEPCHDDPDDTLNSRFARTQRVIDRFKEKGFTVTEMWECEFKKMLSDKSNVELHDVKNDSIITVSKLTPRSCFYGGRTENMCTYYECKEGEKIEYLDVCSLYPYVFGKLKFPIKHPQVFVGSECKQKNLYTTEGIVKLKILPPYNLLYPVLPLKQNNKLMFVLCETCGDSMTQSEECSHSDEERSIIGCYVIDEVRKAMDLGYRVMEVYEIWEYEVLQLNGDQPGLFTEIMNKFIKIKQEASGWPENCTTDELKAQYIQDFYNAENIQLDESRIEKNPGLRTWAKLCVNSVWGRLGQKEDRPQTVITKDPSVFFDICTDNAKEVNTIIPINHDSVVINYNNKDEAAVPLDTVNVIIAAYTTTHARLKLYNYIEQLTKDRLLYVDTDSLVFVTRPGDTAIETGPYIGCLTNELSCYGEGSYITAFCSAGPKNYSYKVMTSRGDTETVCKVKGIRINYKVGLEINFEKMKDLVLNGTKDTSISIKYDSIVRTKTHDIVTKPAVKTYRAVSSKRVFSQTSCGTSKPYGFTKKRKHNQ